jgi:hypothetical protein
MATIIQRVWLINLYNFPIPQAWIAFLSPGIARATGNRLAS